MTILENKYYEILPRKWSYYFLKEFEKIRQDGADSLGVRIEFLKKRLAELCTQRYIIKGSRKGKRIFCNKIENALGKWGCNDYRKRKHGRQLGKSNKKFIKYKRFRKEWRKPFKKYFKKRFNYKRRNNTHNIPNANVGNVEN